MKGVFTLTTQVGFEASHQLFGLPAGHKCSRLHGHSYKVDVTVCGPKLNKQGMLIDTSILKDEIRSLFDHKHVNDVLISKPLFMIFDQKVPSSTAENMAMCLAEYLNEIVRERGAKHAQVLRVVVRETDSNAAEYDRVLTEPEEDGEEDASEG